MTNEELIRNYKFVNKLIITHGDLVELIEMREEIVENLILNTRLLIKKYTKNDEDFKALQQAQDFTSDQKRRIIELAAERAKMLAVQTGRYVIS